MKRPYANNQRTQWQQYFSKLRISRKRQKLEKGTRIDILELKSTETKMEKALREFSTKLNRRIEQIKSTEITPSQQKKKAWRKMNGTRDSRGTFKCTNIDHGNPRRRGQNEMGRKNIWSNKAEKFPNLVKYINLQTYPRSSARPEWDKLKDAHSETLHNQAVKSQRHRTLKAAKGSSSGKRDRQ